MSSKPKFDKEYIEEVNQTDRSKGGAVGQLPLVYRWVQNLAHEEFYILDYGAGRGRTGVRVLSPLGYRNIDSYDIGENVTPEHRLNPREGSYDVVCLSNILNVQPNEHAILAVMGHVVSLVATEGKVIWNYPDSPRKSGLDTNVVKAIVSIFLPYTRMLQPGVFVSAIQKGVTG
jgi:hypothetical protein